MTKHLRTTFEELMGKPVQSACDLDPFKELELTTAGRSALDQAAQKYLYEQVNLILQPHGCYMADGGIYTHPDVVPMHIWNPTGIRAAIRAIDFDPVYCKHGNPEPRNRNARRDVAS
jgi:hypothetical protein